MPADLLAGIQCEVCGEEPAVGVAAVPGMPLSVAYGRTCLDAGASPLWAVVANTVLIGGLENAADWWKEEVTATLRHLGVSEEDFAEMVTRETVRFQADEEADERVERARNNEEDG